GTAASRPGHAQSHGKVCNSKKAHQMRIKYASTTMGGTSLRSMHQGLSKVAPMSLQRRACRGGRRSRRHPCRSFEFGGDNIAVVLHLLEQAPELLLGHAG